MPLHGIESSAAVPCSCMVQGKVYANALWSDNTSFDAPYKYDEARGASEGGYALVSSTGIHTCLFVVSCLMLACMFRFIFADTRTQHQRVWG